MVSMCGSGQAGSRCRKQACIWGLVRVLGADGAYGLGKEACQAGHEAGRKNLE